MIVAIVCSKHLAITAEHSNYIDVGNQVITRLCQLSGCHQDVDWRFACTLNPTWEHVGIQYKQVALLRAATAILIAELLAKILL